jgi:hypothetical protein
MPTVTHAEWHNKYHMLSVIMLSVIMLSVVMLSVRGAILTSLGMTRNVTIW